MGGGTAAGAAPAKHNATAYDTLDVCSLADEAALQSALGEAPGKKSPRSDETLKGCHVDASSGKAAIFIIVRRSPAGGDDQFRYDRSVADAPKDVDGLGAPAFSYQGQSEAHVEVLDGDLVVRVSFVYYPASGVQVGDAPELVGRLTGLAKLVTGKV